MGKGGFSQQKTFLSLLSMHLQNYVQLALFAYVNPVQAVSDEHSGLDQELAQVDSELMRVDQAQQVDQELARLDQAQRVQVDFAKQGEGFGQVEQVEQVRQVEQVGQVV